MATEIEITKLMKVMRAMYANSHFQDWEAPRKGYCMMLADIPYEILEAAVKQCVSQSEFFPSIAALRKAAAEIQIGAKDYPPAAEAWGQFVKLAQYYGHDHKPLTFDNPILEKAINALGWYDLCISENQVADRARFIEVYNQYLERDLREAVTLPEVRAVEQAVIAQISVLAKKLAAGNGRN